MDFSFATTTLGSVVTGFGDVALYVVGAVILLAAAIFAASWAWRFFRSKIGSAR